MSWKGTAQADVSKEGAFQRVDSAWRNFVSSEPGARFPPEANRYHLYVSLACPWACGTLAMLHLKGLENVIGVSVTHAVFQKTRPAQPDDPHHGWAFANPGDPPKANPAGLGAFSCDGCVPDTVNNAKYVRDLYDIAGDTLGRYTVPILWDSKLKTIVSNESAEILRILNSAFNSICKHPEVDMYPERLRPAIDAAREWVYPTINNGVYRCGFAKAQAPYEEAFDQLFASLDRVEAILGKQKWLAGDVMTEADIRLFMTLIRFDPVYVVYFKTNKKFIREYPRMREYVRDMYSNPAVAAAVDMKHIKEHYFASHTNLNPFAVVPKGGPEWWKEAPKRRGRRWFRLWLW